MRIAHFTNSALPIRNGVSVSISRFCDALEAIGHQTKVFANPIDLNKVDVTDRITDLEQSSKAKIYRKRHLFSDIVKDFSPDIIHVHYPFSIGRDALKFSNMLNVPLIFTFHTDYEIYSSYHVCGNSIARFVAEMYVRQYCRFFCKEVDVVISPSVSFAEKMRERYRIYTSDVLSTPVPLERVPTGNRLESRQELEFANSDFVLGYVGRLGKEKSIDRTIVVISRLLHEVANLKVIFVGTGDQRAAVEIALSQFIDANRVRFFQAESFDELAVFYCAMDVILILSETETQGLVVAEALSCGCPVIAVAATGLVDVIRDGENGILLQTRDYAEVKSIIMKLICNQELWSSLSMQARNSASGFGLYDAARSAEQIYERAIINGKGRSSRFSQKLIVCLGFLEKIADKV